MLSNSIPGWGWLIVVIGLSVLALLIAKSVIGRKGSTRSHFASPYLVWIILFTLLPLILIGIYAFADSDRNFTLDNLRTFWDSNHEMREVVRRLEGDAVADTIGRGYVNVDTLGYSLWMALLCTLICLLLGYPAAMFMADRKMRFGSSIIVLFIIPMWMNFLLRTVAWMTLLEDNGPINTILKSFGITGVQLLYNNGAVLFGMVYNFLPFMVFPIYTNLSKIDASLSEAAADLGCNRYQTLRRVVIPLSIPGILSGFTMVFMPSVTTFFIPRVLGGGHTQMFGDLIESTFLTAGNWNLGSAMSLVMMLIILLSLTILRKTDPGGEGSGIA